MSIIQNWKPDYIFVDRSEGLYYEDFSWLKEIPCVKVFDASQYVTNIMARDYTNPFDMGFDIILTSLHKLPFRGVIHNQVHKATNDN